MLFETPGTRFFQVPFDLGLNTLDRLHLLIEVFGSVDHVWNAALPEQFDEIQPEAELTGSAGCRNLTVREKGEDGLLAEMFLELLFVYKLLGDIQLSIDSRSLFRKYSARASQIGGLGFSSR